MKAQCNHSMFPVLICIFQVTSATPDMFDVLLDSPSPDPNLPSAKSDKTSTTASPLHQDSTDMFFSHSLNSASQQVFYSAPKPSLNSVTDQHTSHFLNSSLNSNKSLNTTSDMNRSLNSSLYLNKTLNSTPIDNVSLNSSLKLSKKAD